MKTKILLRFLVTIVILAAVVLGVWLIWFKPSNELEVFNVLTELQNDRQANHKKVLDYTSNSEDENNGIKQNVKAIADADDTYSFDDFDDSSTVEKIFYGAIAYMRGYMFGFDGKSAQMTSAISNDKNVYKNVAAVADFTVINENANFEKMYGAIDEAFKYYYSYVQLAEDVSKSEVDEIKKVLKDLNASYDTFANNVDSVYDILDQKSADKTTMLSEVASLYVNITNEYFEIVKNYNDLTILTKDFVVKHVFDGNIAYDAKTVYYDVVLNSIEEVTSLDSQVVVGKTKKGEDIKKFVKYTVTPENNLFKVEFLTADKFNNFAVDTANVLKAGYPEQKEIKAYANVSKNYAEGLTGEHGIFKVNRESKTKIKNNDAEAKSWYNETYFNEVQTLVLTFFGV